MLQPFGNQTSHPPAAWHPEPRFRGTFSVLSTCILTLILCIWTAIHPNLPEPGKEHRQKWHKAWWVFLGLLAPEAVAWSALGQRSAAKLLTKKMKRLAGSCEGDQPVKRVWWLRRACSVLKVVLMLAPNDVPDHERFNTSVPREKPDGIQSWTDLHSWYAVMGGFVIETSNPREAIFPGGRRRMVLTPNGIAYLAEHWPDMLPYQVRDELEDKSKSDSLAKVITCAQAGWFCCQCIFRLSQGAEITLLELNVFGHALCALFIYILWWTKPKDVGRPIVIACPDTDAVAALLCQLSPVGQPRMVCRMMGSAEKVSPMWAIVQRPQTVRTLVSTAGISTYRLRDVTFPNALSVDETFWALVSQERRQEENADEAGLPTVQWLADEQLNREISIDQFTNRRLRLIRHPELLAEVFGVRGSQEKQGDARIRALVQNRAGNSGVHEKAKYSGDLVQQSAFLYVALMLYGALHLAAWNAGFRTQREQLLWRISSLTLTLAMPALSALTGVLLVMSLPIYYLQGRKLFDEGTDTPASRAHRVAAGLSIWLFCLAFWGAFCFYLCARAYLVVESFMSIAYLSDDMRQVAAWAQYVPHVS